VWACGDALIHWTGASWTVVDFGATDGLNGIGGSGPNDVWTAASSGLSTIQHWNGTTWSSIPLNGTYSLRGLWASGPQDAWAVGFGQGGTGMLHWNGTLWSFVPSAGASSIWGLDAEEIWAVGAGGLILRYSVQN
jgi:hypothetical protein